MTRQSATQPEEIWIVTPIWGQKYWQFFTQYCLPSLLTDHNIGAFHGYKVRYLILTLKEDVAPFQDDVCLRELSRHVSVGFIYISKQLMEQYHYKNYNIMSRCHSRALAEAKNIDAAFFFIFPDTVISNGSIRFSLDMCAAGYRAVMVSGFRAKKEELCPVLENYRLPDRLGTLPLQARDLARVALDKMHPISKAHMQKGDRVRMFARHYWPLEDWGILERAFHPGPFFLWPMVKTDQIHSTLDHDLVKLAVPDQSKIHLVTDSDNLLVCEASETHYQAASIPVRTLSIDEFADWALNWTNDFHRDFVRERIVIRTKDAPIPEAIRAESDRMVERYLSHLEKLNGDFLTDFVQGERRQQITGMIELFSNLRKAQEYGAAWQLAGRIEELAGTIDKKLFFGQWLQVLQFHTSKANVAERIFCFERAIESLREEYDLLDRIQKIFVTANHPEINLDLLSSTQRAYGNNLAFMAPRHPDYFPIAENTFWAERNNIHSKDTLSQDLALFHLYLDWGKQDAAQGRLKAILGEAEFGLWEENPDQFPVTADPFVLSAWLKFLIYQDRKPSVPLWRHFNLINLITWYGDAVNDHPFQLICAYLGRLALRYGSPEDRPQDFFYHAMSIPKTGNLSKACHGHAIRAQILTYWAMIDSEAGRNEAAGFKMGRVLSFLEAVSYKNELAPLLQLQDGKAVGGWLAEAWETLRKVDWSTRFSREACQCFLDCFTFIYH